MNLKFSDLLQQYGVPYTVTIASVKMNVPTKFGDSNIVVVEQTGKLYDWFVSPPTFQKLFIEQGVNVGDVCEVSASMLNNKKMYALKKTGEVAPPISPLSSSNSSHSSPSSVSSFAKDGELKDNRISLAGIVQALIVRKEHDIETCKAMAKELVRWLRQEAIALYEEEHEMEV